MSRFLQTPDVRDHTLIQCIEYDWCVVVRCPACGYTVRWGAVALVEKFREQLRRTVAEVAVKVTDHCEGRWPAVYTIQGAGMELWTLHLPSELKDMSVFRDRRLRNFLAKHDLPAELADERKAVALAELR